MANPTTVFGEIISDIRSTRCLPGLSVGLIVSLVVIVVEVSFATMIFSGPLKVHVQKGIGMALTGAMGFMFFTALLSSIRSVVAFPQDAPVALFSGVAAVIGATMGRADGHEAFVTISAALMFSCLLTGAFFLFIGRFRLADFFRFMPYPVVSGFLAGTGWLLIKGALEVMTGFPLAFDSIINLASPQFLVFWLPGAAYALTLFLILRGHSHYLILPGSLVLAMLFYYAILWVLGISVAEARHNGFLFETFAAGSLWPSFGPHDFRLVEWSAILKELPSICVIPFISLLGLLLNTGGIELASKQEIDMNRELIVNGGANTLLGMAGAPPGYSSISLSVLGLRVGADTRLIGLTAAIIMGATLAFGSQLLAFFPKALLGGFLLLLGLFFLSDWLVDPRKKMPLSDYLLVVTVFLVICVFGYFYGVVFGLVMTMILFVVRISRIPLLRDVKSGDLVHSIKGRPLPDQRLLAIHGDRTAIYELEGYVFFGSVTKLIDDVSSAVRNIRHTPVEVIILDFRKVSGFDISSINNFVRLINRFSRNNLLFAFAGPPEAFNTLLIQNLDSETGKSLRFFPDLDSALEWAEERLLQQEKFSLRSPESVKTERDSLFDSVSDELLLKLDLQAFVEDLIEKLSEYLVVETYQKDEVVLSCCEEAEGLYMVRTGIVAEMIEVGAGRSTQLRDLGPGTLFAELGAYGPWQPSCGYIAKSDVELCKLTPEELERLETENPSQALQIHRLVIEQVRAQNRKSTF